MPDVGAVSRSNDFFKGFIYSFEVWNYVIDASEVAETVETGANLGCAECEYCPHDFCLSECNANEAYYEDSCQQCLEYCQDGCLRPTDCIPCEDD
jgi:hypothetical protein